MYFVQRAASPLSEGYPLSTFSADCLKTASCFWSLVMVPSCGKWSVGQFPTPGGGLEHYYSLTLYHERSLQSRFHSFIVLIGTKDKSDKTVFGVEAAGFETGFSVPKARALPLLQSYAVNS